MRILFASNPEKSVFLYLAPLAWALRTAGHEVCFAGQPALTDVITQAGLTAVPAGLFRDIPRLLRMAAADLEIERPGIPEPYDAFDDPDKATWEYLKPGMVEAVSTMHRPPSFPLIGGLTEFALEWKPDLIIWEPLCYAGPIAAKAVGAAHARMLFGVDVFGVVREMYTKLNAAQPAADRSDPLAEWLATYGRKYDFEYSDDMTTGHFTIDQMPLSLQVEAESLDYVRMQYVPYGGPAVVPKWLWAQPERPRVALTMGLTATEVYNGYTIAMAEVLDSLADLDIEVVATVAEKERKKLPTLPSNVRLESYVPWHALVPTCSAVIHHGGAATMATNSLYPVPQLALHYHYDQPTLGRKLAEHGAGLEMHTTVATGDAVRASVQRLLTEPHFQVRAQALTDEIRALPTPNQLVPQLEQLTAKYRTNGR
ncbi:activator-dependent family glycosyltransferase [Actinoplanes sp. NEAU-A12]|uniref:Activator-dependent family glycosyltransferase n=1 Tax=Actinoplanes sandaracinus TaxID=3045177 RepID=A0ABT6WZJ1_9ACTN|nr:activator-dependent family glycosyltransferase [Actinoplanes sandaracinus]MDI6105164.1 activator-dependent family glycosyltransferase [Actinoplanes sandaracinus]